MFKSVFTKYITAFMLIIIVCFTILATIVSSLVLNHYNESTQGSLYHTADNVRRYITNKYQISGEKDFGVFIETNKESLQPTISLLALNAGDNILFVIDAQGDVVLSDFRAAGTTYEGPVATSIVRDLQRGIVLRRSDTLEGFFDQQYVSCAVTIPDVYGNIVGSVFAATSAAQMNNLVEVLVKTIIMTSLWVLLAALIAVYFISEKIIQPLKEMSRASKKFAAGQFDVRVPVIGHDEVSELAVAFNQMAASLATLEDLRRTFLANVSHDLRTPMTTIAGFIDGILEGAIPPEKHEYYLQVIAGEVRRLSRLVSTLLDISRIQAGDRKFNMEPFDICEMARQILISFEQKIDEKKLDVEFDVEEDRMIVSADRDAIYQIFYNICDNAVKFSREGGKYRISIRSRDSRRIEVSVFNEGEGIAPNDLPYIFDRFYKGDKSRGLDKTGTGLGLFIAKTIIDAHHEEITATSEYGENCCFTFTLQRAHESPARRKQ